MENLNIWITDHLSVYHKYGKLQLQIEEKGFIRFHKTDFLSLELHNSWSNKYISTEVRQTWEYFAWFSLLLGVGFDRDNFLHSSYCGAVFLICAKNSADNTGMFWCWAALAQSSVPYPTSSLTHPSDQKDIPYHMVPCLAYKSGERRTLGERRTMGECLE